MSTNSQFDWVEFYKELAPKLLFYKSDRKELINKVKQIYEKTGFKMPTMDKDNQLVDIDPFTVFGLFNKKLTDANRITILKVVAELFDISSPIPQSFDSLPVLNPQNATFYPFITERQETDIDELWGLYDAALAYAKAPTAENRARVAKHFDVAVNIKYNGNSKITIAKSTGKVTVKKGLKKGTYKVKVKVKAAGTSNYNALTKTVTFTIKVK